MGRWNHMVMATARATAAQLDRAFGALSDPTRRAILARLAQGGAGVLDVAAPFPMRQPAITKYLNVLEEAGLITRRPLARQRLCHLEPVRFRQLSDWVGSYREFWKESFERIDELLEELQGNPEPERVARQRPDERRKQHSSTEGGAT